MPDLRYGRPSGMVVQGTRVDLLPPRDHWERVEEQRTRKRCLMCDLYRDHPKLRAAHVYKTVLATEHFG